MRLHREEELLRSSKQTEGVMFDIGTVREFYVGRMRLGTISPSPLGETNNFWIGSYGGVFC